MPMRETEWANEGEINREGREVSRSKIKISRAEEYCNCLQGGGRN